MHGEAPVSVVIPAHDAARTLADAVASAQAQQPPPREVIVVDDGSRDGTPAVAAAFPGVHLIRQRNQGPAAARNRGVAVASGEWVAFLDADDVWRPERLARQLDVIRRYPDVQLVGSAVPSWTLPGRRQGRFVERGLRVVGHRDLLFACLFPTTSVLARRSLLVDAGGFDPAVDGAEDWDLWLRCAQRAQVAVVQEPLVDYRDRPDSYSKDLARTYHSTQLVLARETAAGQLPRRDLDDARAWHHVKFALGFLAVGDRAGARAAWRAARAGVPAAALLRAAAGYGVPYAFGRAVVRSRSRRPLRVAATSA